MPRLSKTEIQTRIRAALVQEVAQKGIGAVSVNDVAKAAKVSPGTIYLHFENKTDMLQKVYLQIKTEFHSIMMAAKNEQNSAATIKKMWFDMFDFTNTYPYDFLFIEVAGATQVLTTEQAQDITYMQSEIAQIIETAIVDQTLANMPVKTAIVLLVAPALHLARTSILNDTTISTDELDLTFRRVWLSLTV